MPTRNGPPQLDRELLTRATDSLIQAITAPEFVERMHAFRDEAGARDVSFDEVGKLLSVESLREAGAELPDDFRLTSRTFEDRLQGWKIDWKLPDELKGDRVGPVSWGACAGGGAASVCGCAGGGS